MLNKFAQKNWYMQVNKLNSCQDCGRLFYPVGKIKSKCAECVWDEYFRNLILKAQTCLKCNRVILNEIIENNICSECKNEGV